MPLIALRHDMLRRCTALGISCVAWEGSQSAPDAASIVMVTPESALSDEFGSFLNRLKETQQLDRIIINECHVVLNMEGEFRPKLRQVGKLGRMEVQMVLLTATLPPSEEALLWERISWNGEDVQLFRIETARKNIAYSMVRLERRLKRDKHDNFVARLVSQMEGKGVVYCKAKRRVKALAEAGLFIYEAFHADLDGEKKASILESFRTGETQCVVATDSLGIGVDIPDIR